MLLNKLQIIVSSTRINRRINVLISVRRFFLRCTNRFIFAQTFCTTFIVSIHYSQSNASQISKNFNIKLNIFIKIIIRDDYKSKLKFGF